MRLSAASPLIAALFLSPLAGFGQKAAVSRDNPGVSTVAVAGENCPVSLSARYAQQGALRNVSPSEGPARQSYRLSFRLAGGEGLAAARVSLHGFTGTHILPVEDGRPEPGKGIGETEPFTLSFSGPREKGLFESVVYPKGLRGVDWIELEEVTFADGQSWHSPAPGSCRVVPNGFLPVVDR